MWCVPCLTGVQPSDQAGFPYSSHYWYAWCPGASLQIESVQCLQPCNLYGWFSGWDSCGCHGNEMFLSSWLNWTSTKTLDLLKDQIQIETIESTQKKMESRKRSKTCFFSRMMARPQSLMTVISRLKVSCFCCWIEFVQWILFLTCHKLNLHKTWLKPIRRSTLGWKSSCPFTCLLLTKNESSVWDGRALWLQC